MTRAAIALAVVASIAACSTRAPSRTASGPGTGPTRDASAPIRVAIVTASSVVSGTSSFDWYGPDGQTPVARGQGGEAWRLERDRQATRVRAVRPDGVPTNWQSTIIARTGGSGFLTLGGKRYRGELQVVPHGDSIAIVNRVSLEDYLLAVVAVEMGNRPASDAAANEAQAVAARSYAMRRMGNGERPFDVYSTVADQAYGGVDAENAGATAAVRATRGLVLLHEGRVADAVYSSTCGGSTAAITEVWWRRTSVPYLRSVSDRIGASDRYYCDIAPRYRWTATLTSDQLQATLARYLTAYATVPPGGPGQARQLIVSDRTPTGRVGTLRLTTDRGTFEVRANDIRFVLRTPSGGILNSTYFSVEAEHDRGGAIDRVVLRGHGYGHGIGMCQWGAIGRSRAGQSFRTILATYYPGTTVGAVQ